MLATLLITHNFSIEPLVNITDPDFAKAYELGVWWALYGDEQGKGRYDDRYLIENVALLLKRGFDLSHLGFYIGMIHGGTIDPVTLRQQESVILRQPVPLG